MVERQRGEKEGESYNGSQEDAERAQGDRGPGAGAGGGGWDSDRSWRPACAQQLPNEPRGCLWSSVQAREGRGA